MKVGVLLLIWLIVVMLLFVVAWSLFDSPPLLGLAVLGIAIPGLTLIAMSLVAALSKDKKSRKK